MVSPVLTPGRCAIYELFKFVSEIHKFKQFLEIARVGTITTPRPILIRTKRGYWYDWLHCLKEGGLDCCGKGMYLDLLLQHTPQ